MKLADFSPFIKRINILILYISGLNYVMFINNSIENIKYSNMHIIIYVIYLQFKK